MKKLIFALCVIPCAAHAALEVDPCYAPMTLADPADQCGIYVFQAQSIADAQEFSECTADGEATYTIGLFSLCAAGTPPVVDCE